MVIRHCSRERAERHRGVEPYALISITDPDAPLAALKDDPLRLALLRIQFHDITHEPETFEKLVPNLRDRYILPAAHHATTIVAFFRQEVLARRLPNLLVHCEAGISRSAGVGAGLAYCIRQSEIHFYHHSRPNQRVRQLVIDAWRAQC